jgi:hypothetical protein
MAYTDAELDALQQENYFKELEQDAYQFASPLQPGSLLNLKTADNPEKFKEVDYLISKGENLTLQFGIDNGLPYYKINVSPERKVTLYLNREIVQYIYSWIKDGVRLPKAPNTWDVQKNANERYMLFLIKRDFNNKVLKGTNTNPNSFYPNGTINYGELPYSRDELIAKLEAISLG